MNVSNCNYTNKYSNLTSTIAQDGVMWFLLFAVPIVAVFGIIGNMFSFVILKESVLKNVSHLYLVCLSVFDSLTLITILYTFYAKVVLFPILVQRNVDTPFIIFIMNAYATCPFRLYTTFSMRFISIWTIVLFSIDRTIAIAFPMQSRTISTIKNTIIVISILIVISFLVNIPFLLGYERVRDPCNNYDICKSNKITTVMLSIEFTFLTLIPSIIICVCNITIIYILRKRREHSTLFSKKEAMDQEKMITIRLLLVSTCFVLLTLPSLIIICIHTNHKLRGDLSYKRGPKANALHIGLFLFTLNLSINFILYCLTGNNFRRAAWSILRCRYNEMRYYRKVILNPNLVTETDVSDLTDPNGRNNSTSSDKNNFVVDLSKGSHLPLKEKLIKKEKI